MGHMYNFWLKKDSKGIYDLSNSDKWCKHSGSIPVSVAKRHVLIAWCSLYPQQICLAALLPIWWRSGADFSYRSQISPLLCYCWRWSRPSCELHQKPESACCSPPRSGAKPALGLVGNRSRRPWWKNPSPCRTQSTSDQLFGQSHS